MDYSPEFEYFWRVYPKRWDRARRRLIKRKKHPAWKSWQKLDKDTQHEILTKAKFIKDFEGGYPSDAVTWLNNRGWDDIEFKSDYVPVLPEELRSAVFKRDNKVLDINTERNRQRKAMGL